MEETKLETLESLESKQEQKMPNPLDGYVIIDRDELPQHGELYPASWAFAYRGPTTNEVAAFSTIIETDRPAVMQVIEDLIRKCVIIYDTEKDSRVNVGHICDGHRTFFLLKIRNLYLPERPIEIKTMCTTCKEAYDAPLTAESLEYRQLKDRLLEAYDGRVFNLELEGANVRFHVPTLDTAAKIFKYIIKTYRATANQKEMNPEDNIVHDKQFLLFAPYLFENGTESIREIINKYKRIRNNDNLYKAYLTIVNNLNLENEEMFGSDCPHCGSFEETQISFPGGYRKLFVSKPDPEGYF